MGTSGAETEFSAMQFEKTLTNLKDSQESINQCCQWCLSNRQHYKKIVNSWLNVLKRVKIEQRLTLFYLANDVVQYSKRRNYEYVDTWGTAIQKATTMVRDEKVKHKILRIFKIWEQRGVYGEEFIADLCGLINIQPTGPKSDEPHEFQAAYVINKIKNCANLERDTDTKLKMLKEHNPKIQISEGLINSLKDRAHVDDVEKELDVYVDHMESYINALKVEIKNRIALISALKQAETQLESDRKDVKMVAHAYRTFGQRVKVFQKKMEEHMDSLPSPIPSPDINAPSPSPEEDLELPEDDTANTTKLNSTDNSIDISAIQYTNPGYYVPPPTNTAASTASYNNSYSSFNSTTVNSTNAENSSSFLSNGFTSFLGQNLSFDISNISTTGLFSNSMSENTTIENTQTTNSYVTTPSAVAQIPGPVAPPVVDLTNDMDNTAPYNPLLPPPMPPFSKNNESGFSFNSSMDISATAGYDPAYQPPSYTEAAYSTETSMNSTTIPNSSHYDYQLQTGANPYPPGGDESYDPSQVTEPWEEIENSQWNELKDIDTPESPPIFEKEGYGDPVEYHDSSVQSGAVDIDQRVIPGMGDLEDSLSSLGGKDVDHRNLISLTGSPNVEPPINGSKPPKPLPARGNLKTITPQESLWDTLDQDYRGLSGSEPPAPAKQPPLPLGDQDYRLQFNLDAPPPPPPPPKSPVKRKPPPPPPLPAPGTPGDPRLRYNTQPSPKKGDIVDDVDMDLSDDLDPPTEMLDGLYGDGNLLLEPPPPLPDLLDDMDANQFLDEISNELNDFSNLSSELNVPEDGSEPAESNDNSNMPGTEANDATVESNNSSVWGPLQPPPVGFGMGAPPGMGSPPGMGYAPAMPPPPGGFMPPMDRMNMGFHPPEPPLPMMDGPLMPPQFTSPPNWINDRQQPPRSPHDESGSDMPYDENPYLNDDDIHVYDNFRNNRGGNNNFRGGFDSNFNKSGNFGGNDFRGRGRGRGGRPWVDRGRGRGGNRGGRGGSSFRPRGFFRGRGR